MPTPAEQKALAFVALVLLLGGAVRVVRGDSPATANSAEQQALSRQATAAESATTIESGKRAEKGLNRGKKARRGRYAGAKFDSTGVLIEGTGVVSSTGFPPPGSRIDVDMRDRPLATVGRPPRGGGAWRGASEFSGTSGAAGAAGASDFPGATSRLDLDLADAAAMERLPGIGPALAKRIVASRDSLGPFGLLSALGRVKGIGPATMKRLAPLVTFSGQARR